MNTTILLVGLVVFAFAISRVLARYAARYFVVSGVEYILLGVLLGPVTAVLDADALHAFEPLVALLLGLLGFVQGLQAREILARPRTAISGTFSALLVIVVTGAVCLALIEAIGEGTDAVTYGALPLGDRLLIVAASPDNLRLAGTIGCCAAVSSPVLISDSARVLRARGPASEALAEQGLVSQLVALAVFGGIMASSRASESAAELQIPLAAWVVGIAAFGVLCGLLFIQFIGSERESMRIYIAAVGVVTFSSGVGEALDVTPLVVNLIAGACVSLSPRYARHVEHTIIRLRHPSLVMVRVFAGALWVGVRGLAWLLPPLYALVRVGVRWSTGGLVLRGGGADRPRVPRLGLGLVGQGGFAVAVALSFAVHSPERAGVVLTAVLGGLVLSDLWSHRAVRRVLADAGELYTVPIVEVDEAHEAEASGAVHHAPLDGVDDETLAAEGHQAVGPTREAEDGEEHSGEFAVPSSEGAGEEAVSSEEVSKPEANATGNIATSGSETAAGAADGACERRETPPEPEGGGAEESWGSEDERREESPEPDDKGSGESLELADGGSGASPKPGGDTEEASS